jgi:hypothetical protein
MNVTSEFECILSRGKKYKFPLLIATRKNVYEI